MDAVNFIGIDISKKTLDIAFCTRERPKVFHHVQVGNTPAGFKALLSWLRGHHVDLGRSFFGMEHTGLYGLELAFFLQGKGLCFGMYSPLEVKRSLGLQRGKNDRVDAQRIASYTFLHRHELRGTPLPSATLLKLRNLLAFRDRLVKNKVALAQGLQDLKSTAHLVDNVFIIKATEGQLEKLAQDIRAAEEQVQQAIDGEESLKANFRLACSVPGVALVTAAHLLVHTNNFTSFRDSRQFAAYCGIAPYEHTSGSSVRGRTRNSPLANRRLKALLSNGACSAVVHDKELAAYYARKLAGGKPKMLVLNAVKAKIAARVFAVVKRGSKYEQCQNLPEAA